MLLTVLLVLAIGASSALVFTNRAELLKLAVILALWAAVVAAFVSVIYRRQSDIDQAKVRDLKLVYDLQLDREISARREYELSVETQLRRELTSEIRAQAADEVAGLRAELAALRANLEILFDADLSHRPALETDRSRPAPTATGRAARNRRAGSPPAGSTPKTARTSTRTPRKARSSTCLPNRIRPRPTGRRRRVTAVRTADRRRQSKRSCAIAQRSRRTRGHHRQRHRAAARAGLAATPSQSRRPHPSPNSLGSHRNKSAHPPAARTAIAAAGAPSRSAVAQTPPSDWQPAPAEGEWIPARRTRQQLGVALT